MQESHHPRLFRNHTPSLSVEANPYPRWLTNLGLLLFAFFFICFLWEWFTIGVLADKEKTKEYLFGSEVMMNEGGANYASPEIYAKSALISAVLFCLPVSLLFALAVRKKTTAYRLLAFASILLFGLLRNSIDL